MSRKFRATNTNITPEYLDIRTKDLIERGFKKSRWIDFCDEAIRLGLSASLYEAKHTVSKYITLRDGKGREFKVRFSNHKPIKAHEAAKDCDFFVGVSDSGVTTTGQALDAVRDHFAIREAE